MAKGALKPVGALAEQVAAVAKAKLPLSPTEAAAEALKAKVPDLGRVLGRSGFGSLVARLAKASDRVIAGDAAVQVLAQLQHDLLAAGLRLSGDDLARCLDKSLQLRTARGGGKFRATVAAKQGIKRATKTKQGYKNAFSGELRERVVQHLPAVRLMCDQLNTRARALLKAPGFKGAKVIDTARMGDVRLATVSASGARAPVPNALGPDRIFGVLRTDAKARTGGYAGTLHVTALIEVKAITGGLAGVNQLQKFLARASHGEITIAGKTYRLVLEDKVLQRIMILPENAIDRKQIVNFAKKNGIEVLPYSAAIEKLIDGQSEHAVQALMYLDSALR